MSDLRQSVQLRPTRRGILAKAAALSVAAIAAKAATAGDSEGANGETIKVGGAYVATRLTELGGTFAGPVFEVYNFAAGRGSGALMGLVAVDYPTDPAPAGGAAVFGKHGGGSGSGVWGEAAGAFGKGVTGYATGNGSTGVFAYAEQGDAIYAEAIGDSDYAVNAKSAFHAINATTSGNFYSGVFGVSNGSSGVGITGQAKQNGTGVLGDGGSIGVDGRGDRGVSGNGMVLGVVGSGGMIGVAASAFDAEKGIGVTASGPLAGVLAEVPPGKQDGPGVWGSSGQETEASDAAGTRTGVLGTSDSFGVAGVGGGKDLTRVKALLGKAGVAGIGLGAGSRGVYGTNDQGGGVGVLGESAGARGVGVRGTANPIGIGVLADAPATATALSVQGINRFTQAGRGSFAPGERRHVLTNLNVTGRSGILVTLNSSPGAGVYLESARVNPAMKKGILTLSRVPAAAIEFTYFIVDTPATG